MTDRQRLAQLLRTHAVRSGQFTLSSGAESDLYVDVKATSLTGEGASLIGSLLWDTMRAVDPDALAAGGLTLGADPLVTALSLAAFADGKEIAAILVRKESKGHGTDRFLEAPPTLPKGARVVVIDDVITTAGSTLQALHRLRAEGFVVDHALCVVDREAGGLEALAHEGVTLHALFDLKELRKG
jgi:orotate phosphoribosyltransferase